MKPIGVLVLAATLAMLPGCGTKKLSERDQALQKQQQGVDLKRSELMQIAGQYLGDIKSTDGTVHRVRLMLEVKDVPEAREGTDPMLIPRLLGSLRFILGDEGMGENIDAPIQSSEFIKAKDQLSLVAKHNQFGELVVSAIAKDGVVSGTWNAAAVSRSGEIRVERVQAEEFEREAHNGKFFRTTCPFGLRLLRRCS